MDDVGSRKRFGVFEFDPQTRELTKHGVRLKMQEQPIQILAALLEQAGQIVPREELQRRLWPDGTFVDYEQSLNKAVNKLREALGDSADHPLYVETLSRRGYRFLAPVEGDRTVQPVAKTAAPPRRILMWLAAGGFVLVIVLATGLWPIDVPQVEKVELLTHDTTFKNEPLISDGNRVLYSAEWGVWSVPTSGGEPKRLSLPFLPHDKPDNTALSRDWATILAGYSAIRQRILLRSAVAGKSGAEDLWIAGPDGEVPLKIAEITPPPSGVALAPDGERIALSFPDGVYIQSIGNDQRKRVHLLKRWQLPIGLWWHPSGRKIGFAYLPQKAVEGRVWQVDDDGTHPRRIVPENEDFQGPGTWSRDGKRFFYGSEGEIFLRTQGRILGWLRKPVIARLTASGQFGGWPAVDPVDPKRLYALAGVARGQNMRYDRKARKWVSILPGLSGETFNIAPGGQWMVYSKFPGGELRKCKIDGSGDVLLASGVAAINPSWSPDGKRIVFSGFPAGGIYPFKLWLVSATGGDAAPYRPEIEALDAIWSNDGRRLLLGQLQGQNLPPGESHIKILDLDTGKIELIPGGSRLFSPRWSPDQKQILALDRYQFNPYIFDPVKREWRELAKETVGFPKWSSDGKYIYGRSAFEEKAIRIEVATGRLEEIARMDFKTIGNFGSWVGWTEDWDPLTLRDLSSTQIYRIDLDR
jgi:DNA-binding winged helix-turn-helix (wHTH) protein